jgi:AcrR family transcriptional regulator
MSLTVPDADDVRVRILRAAKTLITEHGPEGLTTRAVAAAAGTQGPTIYRLFGDKRGLLDALAEHAMEAYVADQQSKAVGDDADPVEALRQAWNAHIAFGLAHPSLYHLMSASVRGGELSPVVMAGIKVLQARMKRIALAGRLKVTEERAVALIHAAGTGTITTLLEQEPAARDEGLSMAVYEAVMAAIIADPTPGDNNDLPRLATTLRARLQQDTRLSPGERLLIDEILARLA